MPSQNGSEWRLANGERQKKSAEDVHYSFVACFSRLRFLRHRLRVGGQIGRVMLLPSQNGSEWRLASGE